MNDQTFWQIIEETRDASMEKQEQKLYTRLKQLPEADILEFERLSCVRSLELYSWDLWGVAYLYWGGCSDDGFMDWRNWIVYCGEQVFEIARDRPDELVSVIDAHPDAGCEGIGYVPMKVLRDKNPEWEHATPDFDLPRQDEPRGTKWEGEDLKDLLPKTYKRFEENATEQAQLMRDPDYVRKTFGVTLGEEEVFTMDSKKIEIAGQKATSVRFVPVEKRPWWRFWQRNPMD